LYGYKTCLSHKGKNIARRCFKPECWRKYLDLRRRRRRRRSGGSCERLHSENFLT